MRSLRLRIVLAVALVCVATLFGVASYVGRTTLLIRVGEPSQRTIAALSAAIEPLIAARQISMPAAQRELAQLAAKYNVRIILVNGITGAAVASWGPIDPAGVILQPDRTIQLRQRAGTGRQTGPTLLLRGGTLLTDAKTQTSWRLFVLPSDSGLDALAPARVVILRSIWQSAALGFVVAVVVAVVLGSYIVRPISELTKATKAMGAGDTRRRVAIAGNDEIGQLAASFNTMAESIETTERLRRQMITDVAHELRNPLTRMILQLEAANDGHLLPTNALAGVRDETRRLEQVVNDLRDLSLADAHELSVKKRAVAIDRSINEAIIRMKPQAARAGVTLEPDIDPALPMALGDELRVGQILDNLIGNALQYTAKGGRIVVGAVAKGAYIECFVKDDGLGVAPEHLPFIFERFYRADASRDRATGGSGLGLAIVKSLVEAQNGSVGVESGKGRGSRFTWTLPIVGTRSP